MVLSHGAAKRPVTGESDVYDSAVPDSRAVVRIPLWISGNPPGPVRSGRGGEADSRLADPAVVSEAFEVSSVADQMFDAALQPLWEWKDSAVRNE